MARSFRPDLLCMQCKVKFQRKHGQGLFCSSACAERARLRKTAHATVLTAAGFTVEGNKFTRDGHSLTLEEVSHVGLVQALTRHAAATAQKN